MRGEISAEVGVELEGAEYLLDGAHVLLDDHEDLEGGERARVVGEARHLDEATVVTVQLDVDARAQDAVRLVERGGEDVARDLGEQARRHRQTLLALRLVLALELAHLQLHDALEVLHDQLVPLDVALVDDRRYEVLEGEILVCRLKFIDGARCRRS